ncbi:ankyrin repeat domain-containing protein [Gottfriedia sp. S16(2024)]|uniref:ankyrin repeat domain-containing protein n=1 Tax=Gottfriedia sp. S16(2024) TaxID=3162883 RepID=UPI003D22C711
MPIKNRDIVTLARFGDFETFKKEFKSREIDKKVDFNTELLAQSIAGENFEISLFLIQNGINVNGLNEDGSSVLHLICDYPNIDVAKEILNHGGNINIRNKYGNNAMWTAVFNCKGKYYDMVELFMQYNPDTTTKNNAGRSPLDFAKQVGNEKLIEILTK